MYDPASNSGRIKRQSLFQNVQMVSRAHPASYSMGTGVLYRGKANGT